MFSIILSIGMILVGIYMIYDNTRGEGANSSRARALANIFGQKTARSIYIGAGGLIILMGVVMLIMELVGNT